jgi:Sap, sulfolipid-1-addressing protein
LSTEALVLALSTVVRPTSAAAVFAMLSTARPTRLLLAYVVTGFLFSAGVGVAVVVLLGGWTGPDAPDEVRALIAVLLGALSLGYAAGLLLGQIERRVPVQPADGPTPAPDSWLGRQLTDLTPARAATAGVLTHLPGLFYLAALNAITNSTASDVSRILQVAAYNAIWFALPIVALVLATHRPAEVQDVLRRLTDWIHCHERTILIIAFGLLGGYLVVKGAIALAS